MSFSNRNQQNVVGSVSVVIMMVLGIVGCSWFEGERADSPTAPTERSVALGNYAQQPGLSSVVTINGETHQINGVVSGSVVAGGTVHCDQ